MAGASLAVLTGWALSSGSNTPGTSGGAASQRRASEMIAKDLAKFVADTALVRATGPSRGPDLLEIRAGKQVSCVDPCLLSWNSIGCGLPVARP